ncbi:MAG: SUF system NifU family Fe-S cluster assembly protein [Acidobacteria bacterium CG_4_9_14_3_um_filter_49_7]|nr:MAG: SUF system NifU family Fe-S cluster assembly protein [Acidobacteria bacterium CG_4_9_14_3_um_filter_49_7]
MTTQLDNMYRDLILDHYEHPRNCHELNHTDRTEEGFNPLCGDHVNIQFEQDGRTITDISVCTKGCAICTASGSIMSDILKGLSVDETKSMVENVKAFLTGDRDIDPADLPSSLQALSGVRKFPIRIKCALLPWTTAELALNKK